MNSKLVPVSEKELQTRIELNYRRLAEGDYYSTENVFSPKDYDWYADKEGRALLAFVSHYKINGKSAPCMGFLMEHLQEHMNEDGYFGPVFADKIHEQQLSGHSWLLRGLCEYYEAFGDEYSKNAVEKIADNLYLKRRGRFSTYPIERSKKDIGDVSGTQAEEINGWILSSDIGCAFMSIDGLSHAYKILKKEDIKALLDEMITVYLGVDKVKLKAQTHCTLSAARGMLRMYGETGEAQYLKGACDIMKLYTEGGGMSETYQNLNWWGRADTWTEPCAIVDSLMVACELYKAIGDEKYKTLAARIYHNGLATAQRQNGGAGTDSVVVSGVEEYLYSKMYEAEFCCTMRLAEGLWYISDNKELLTAKTDGCVTKKGRIYSDGDLIYAEIGGGAQDYVEKTAEVDGYKLSPIVKYYRLPKDVMESSKQRILF